MIRLNVAHRRLFQENVTPLHFFDRPLEGENRFFGVGNHRRQEMGRAIVDRQFHPFWVNHQEAQTVGRIAVKKRSDKSVNDHRLARAGGAGNQNVRRSSEIGKVGQTGNAATERDEQRLRRTGEFGAANERGQTDNRFSPVGNFHPDQRLAGNRRFNPDGMSGERQGQVVVESENPRELDALGRLQGVTSDGGADRNLSHFHRDAEILERPLDDVGVGFDVAGARLAAVLFQKFQGRRREGAAGRILRR